MGEKSTGGRAENFLFYFLFYFSDSVCMYVYILEGHWDARHVRPLTFNTHIFCQCNSMQTTDLVRLEVRDPEVQSRKRRPNSICGNDGQILYACLHRLLVLHPAVFLVHYLTLMSMTSVFAVSTSHTLTRTSHSVVVPFTRIIFPTFNVFEAHAHSTQKKKKKKKKKPRMA